MSLFLGKNTDGKAQLHLSSDVRSSVELDGASIQSTVFHSSLEYIIGTVYSYTAITDGKATIPSEAIQRILDGYTYIILYSDTTDSVSFDSVYNRGQQGTEFWYDADGNSQTSPTLTFNRIHISPHVYCKVVVFNISDSAYVPPVSDSSGITISGTEMLVNGVDLASIVFLQRGLVNTEDINFTALGNTVFQLVNSTPTSTLTLAATGDGSIVIKGNTKTIFDTSLSYGKNLFGTKTSVSVDFTNGYGEEYTTAAPTQTKQLGSGYVVGGIIFLSVEEGNPASPIANAGSCFVYTEGTIATYGNYGGLGESGTSEIWYTIEGTSGGKLELVATAVFNDGDTNFTMSALIKTLHITTLK